MTTESGLAELNVTCPYCGEEFSTVVDFSSGAQEYYEDCQVCCRAILFSVSEDISSASFSVTLKRDDE